MRIVAGKWRGRFLQVADVPDLRPTPERVRETLFNWLAPRIQGSSCLDLFAGTGALGLEALSRGAAQVDLVESAAAAVATLRRNVAALRAESAAVHPADASSFLKLAIGKAWDIVFLDPPYSDSSVASLCTLLSEGGRLAPGAVVYLEQNLGSPAAALPPGWTVRREKKAGNVRYSLIDAAHGPDRAAGTR